MPSKCNSSDLDRVATLCRSLRTPCVFAPTFRRNAIALMTTFAIITSIFSTATLAVETVHQPTWGKPKETRPRPANTPDDEPMDEDLIGDPDAPSRSRGERPREARVSEAGVWKDGDPQRKKPTEECEGDVWYAATSEPGNATGNGGVRYLWVTPAGFDRSKSYDLVVILHPSQSNVFWGMHAHANSDPATGGRFRPDQIVVCVDGLTVTGKGAERRSFVVGSDTVMAFRDVMLELSRSFPIRRMYLYGSESGADFAIAFSQRFPALADGVVAYRASAAVQQFAGKGRMPLVFVQGAKDGLLPLATSIENHRAFIDAGHAGVRLRVLPGFNDYPNPVRVSECIDWMLAMNARGDGAAEEVLHAARGMLEPKESDESGYVGPVWFSGAYEALSRITGTPEGGIIGAAGDNVGERLWRSLGASGKAAKDGARGGGGEISDETLAAASTLQGEIETHAKRHVSEIQKLMNPQASGTSTEMEAGGLPVPDGSPAAAWLWHFRQDFRGVAPAEAYIAAIGYDEAVQTHMVNAQTMAKALRDAQDPQGQVEVAAVWIGRVFLAPTLPLSIGAAAQLSTKQLQDHQEGLSPEVQESLEMIANVDRTWTEGARAYRKVWREWGGQKAGEEVEPDEE